MEIGPAYTELNDPDIQLAKFTEQLRGVDEEESTFRTLDEDFLDALRVGMPSPPADVAGSSSKGAAGGLFLAPTVRRTLKLLVVIF